jgi:hypothetical protein
MFHYDPQLAAATQTPPQTVAEVLALLQTIDATCVDGDGLKWFNWLYLRVTATVEGLVAAGSFHNPSWLAELDVQFARLFFSALNGYLTGGACPHCWAAMFAVRTDARVARIQFALAGINAHINHDLAAAVVATCEATNTIPQHGTPQYADYTAINGTLDGLIDIAKQTLHVRLLGDPLPPISNLENTVAAWGTAAAREQAWNHAQALWQLRSFPEISKGYLDGLDGLTTFGNKTLLVPVY